MSILGVIKKYFDFGGEEVAKPKDEPMFVAHFDRSAPSTSDIRPQGIKDITSLSIRRPKERMNFSSRLIQTGLEKGFITSKDGVFTFKAVDGKTVSYRVLKRPGYYCCHCNKPFDGDKPAKAHVEAQHKGPSPDRSNPHGYGLSHQFNCVLVK